MTKIFNILLYVICSLIYSKLNSQSIVYSYDNNGNRITRIIQLNNKNSLLNDTTSAEDSVMNHFSENVHIQSEVIETKIANNRLSIYPNPVESYLLIETDNINNSLHIFVSDETGKLLEDFISTDYRTRVNFNQKPIGIYFVKIIINNKSETWKIIKK